MISGKTTLLRSKLNRLKEILKSQNKSLTSSIREDDKLVNFMQTHLESLQNVNKTLKRAPSTSSKLNPIHSKKSSLNSISHCMKNSKINSKKSLEKLKRSIYSHKNFLQNKIEDSNHKNIVVSKLELVDSTNKKSKLYFDPIEDSKEEGSYIARKSQKSSSKIFLYEKQSKNKTNKSTARCTLKRNKGYKKLKNKNSSSSKLWSQTSRASDYKFKRFFFKGKKYKKAEEDSTPKESSQITRESFQNSQLNFTYQKGNKTVKREDSETSIAKEIENMFYEKKNKSSSKALIGNSGIQTKTLNSKDNFCGESMISQLKVNSNSFLSQGMEDGCIKIDLESVKRKVNRTEKQIRV